MGGRAALRQSARTVAFVLPSFAGGGAERVVLTLAAHLDRDRFLPTVVVLDGRGPLKQAVPARLEVHDLGRSRLRWAVPRLARVLRRLRPAAIVSTLGHLNLAVLALRPILPPGTRILAREANTPAQSLATVPRPALFRAAYRRLYPGADAVICPSRRIADEMVRDFSVPAGRVRVLPNPVDVDGIRAAAVGETSDLLNTSETNPDVSVATGTDSQGRLYADVTMSYTFSSIFPWPGLPSSIDVDRTVRARVLE